MSVASLSTATSDSDADFDISTDIASSNCSEEISIQGKNFIQRLLLKVRCRHSLHFFVNLKKGKSEEKVSRVSFSLLLCSWSCKKNHLSHTFYRFSPQDPEHQNEHLKDIFSESINWKKTVSVTNHARKKFIFSPLFLYLMSHQCSVFHLLIFPGPPAKYFFSLLPLSQSRPYYVFNF